VAYEPQRLWQMANNLTNQRITKHSNRLQLALMLQASSGLPLPEWTRSVYPEKMRYLAAISLTVFTYNDVLKRLIGGKTVLWLKILKLLHLMQRRIT
jgi:hypothetical protein